MPYDKLPTYLNAEQRYALTQIPADLSDREIARYYTFSPIGIAEAPVFQAWGKQSLPYGA